MAEKIALTDADGTLFADLSLFPVITSFESDNFISSDEAEIVHLTRKRFDSGEIDYHQFVIEAINATARVLAHKEERIAAGIAGKYFSESVWFGYVHPTIEEHARRNTKVGVVTASPQFIGAGIASALSINMTASSKLEVVDGVFTGLVQQDQILSSSQKGQITRGLKQRGIEVVAGYGDSGGDVGMLKEVTSAYCINPTDELRRTALEFGWQIVDHPELPLVLVGSS